MEIDITAFVENADPFDYSHSIAEGGENAGKETWAAALTEGASSPLLTTPEQLEALRKYVKDFGAWSDEEIAAWSDAECNALFIQLISGDLREAHLDGELTEDAWADYERRAGNIFRVKGEAEHRVYYSLTH